jgi:hypothetical protein
MPVSVRLAASVQGAPNANYALRRTVMSRPNRRTVRPTLGRLLLHRHRRFSKFYFSATVISDRKTHGTIGAVFGIMTWLIAIGAVPILGAVTGVAWEEWRNQQTRGAYPGWAVRGPTRSRRRQAVWLIRPVSELMRGHRIFFGLSAGSQVCDT